MAFRSRFLALLALLLVVVSMALAQVGLKDHYKKYEYLIPARDGKKLYANVYVPTDKPGKHPILLERTPYHAEPYGPDTYPDGFPGSKKFVEDGYIFAFADARGSGMSEGDFLMANPLVKSKGDHDAIDESTDTYDQIDYLVKHVPDNNGNVGVLGISYPGYYAAVAGINNHPAVKAISPQAPCDGWFMGDDVHHNGAFFLQDIVSFLPFFGAPRTKLGVWGDPVQFDQGSNAYDFFLKTGSLANIEPLYFRGGVRFWGDMMNHPNYDEYWKGEALEGKMENVKCAVMVVGGWFDAEDQWGAIHLPDQIQSQNPGKRVYRVMGPWFHGMWAGSGGDSFGDLNFGSMTSTYYQDEIEFPFFDRYLRDPSVPERPVATMFETGRNQWRQFAQWPPEGMKDYRFYVDSNGRLNTGKPVKDGKETYTYDPGAPTPYVADYQKSKGRPIEYMIGDQRFAEKRADVVTYETAPLDQDLTVAGPIDADIWIATTGTDADVVVKVIDVWPGDSKEMSRNHVSMAGYEQLLKGDIFRAKFRNSFESPEPIKPGEPTEVHFKLNDCLHTFLKGHRLMVQIQSAWFPLVDRNSNTFEDLYKAKDSDFHPATISILHDSKHPTSVGFGKLN